MSTTTHSDDFERELGRVQAALNSTPEQIEKLRSAAETLAGIGIDRVEALRAMEKVVAATRIGPGEALHRWFELNELSRRNLKNTRTVFAIQVAVMGRKSVALQIREDEEPETWVSRIVGPLSPHDQVGQYLIIYKGSEPVWPASAVRARRVHSRIQVWRDEVLDSNTPKGQ